ncbi:MAG: BMP family ABC transporter substrate-binding protein, partial [Oligoflexia bacterium]|nr:BMP family ABC transporter substrate-binding protein [Oligoflexia bacterium]
MSKYFIEKKIAIVFFLFVFFIFDNAYSASASADNKLKVAFIYVGPVGDMGWSYSHDQGRLEMEKALKGKVETGYIESVQEGPAAERVIEDYAR